MGQQPSKGGPNGRQTPSTPSDKQMLKRMLEQQERQREAHKKQQEKAKQANTSQQSELQRSVLSARHEETPLIALSKSTGFSLILLRRLEVLFNIISGAIIRDNMIDPDELSNALGLSQNSILFLALFRLFDATQSHRVNFRTWVLTLYNLSPQATFNQKCRFSFSLLDLNGDGSIEQQELVNLVKNVINLSAQDPRQANQDVSDINEDDIKTIVDTALKKADINGDGSISYDEYETLMKHSKMFYNAFTIDIDHLCAAFTSPEVQKAVLLSQDESLRRLQQFQQKKYQQVIRESFSEHVVPFMQRLSLSSEYYQPITPTTPTNATNLSTGAPQTETMDVKEWNKFERRALASSPIHDINSPLSSPRNGGDNNNNNNPGSTTPTSGLTSPNQTTAIPGTMADLVRIRSMSGIKAAAIVPSIAIYGQEVDVEGWHLIDDPFASPSQGTTMTTQNNTNNPTPKALTPTNQGISNRSNLFDKAKNDVNNNNNQDTVPKVAPMKPMPRISLSKDVPTLEKKYSNALLTPRQSVAGGPGQGGHIEVTSPRHGRIVRERSEQSLFQRPQRPSLSQSNLPPLTNHKPSSTNHQNSNSNVPLQRNQSDTNNNTTGNENILSSNNNNNNIENNTPHHNTHTNINRSNYPPPVVQRVSVQTSQTTVLSDLPELDVSKPHDKNDLNIKSTSTIKTDKINLNTLPNDNDNNNHYDHNNLPNGGLVQNPHISLTTTPPSSLPINPSLLADLHTISEDGTTPWAPTPPAQVLIQHPNNIIKPQHLLVFIDNTTAPVYIIDDPDELDIDDPEEEAATPMEQTAAPALARLLAALREDNPWD